MTHEEKLAKKAQLEADLEARMEACRRAWIALKDILNRLDPITAAAIVDLMLAWDNLSQEADDAINALHRMNDRITKQLQYPTPGAFPHSIAGPPTSMRTLTTAKKITKK